MMNTAADTRTVVVERRIPHSQAKVWRALTQGPLLEDWLMSNDFDARVGHRFTFRMPPMQGWNGVTDCEVLEVEPQARLAYTWNASGAEAANGLKTVVTWTLTPVAGGVRVRMEQSGFRPHETRNYQGAKYGWQKFVDGLERVAGGLS